MAVPQQSNKTTMVIAPITETVGGSITATFDTLGFAHMVVRVVLSTQLSTKDALDQLKLTEGTDTNAATAIPAFTGTTNTVTTTDSGFILPVGVTTVGQIFELDVDIRKRQRYIKLTVDPDTTVGISATVTFDRGEKQPPASDDVTLRVIG